MRSKRYMTAVLFRTRPSINFFLASPARDRRACYAHAAVWRVGGFVALLSVPILSVPIALGDSTDIGRRTACISPYSPSRERVSSWEAACSGR